MKRMRRLGSGSVCNFSVFKHFRKKYVGFARRVVSPRITRHVFLSNAWYTNKNIRQQINSMTRNEKKRVDDVVYRIISSAVVCTIYVIVTSVITWKAKYILKIGFMYIWDRRDKLYENVKKSMNNADILFENKKHAGKKCLYTLRKHVCNVWTLRFCKVRILVKTRLMFINSYCMLYLEWICIKVRWKMLKM
jgi:hypothetical protein